MLDECVPRDVILDVRLLLQHVLADAIIHRAYRLAFAHDFSRDPLPNFTLGASILNKRFSRPGERVYESWRDSEVVRVDHVRGRCILQIAHAHDAIASNSYVAVGPC